MCRFPCKNSSDSTHCAQFTKGSQAGVQLGSVLPTETELSVVCKWSAPESRGQGFASTTWLSHSQVPTCYLAQANWNQPREKKLGFKSMKEQAEVTELHSTDQRRNNNFLLGTLWKEHWSAKSKGVVGVVGFCTYLRDDGDLEPQVMEPDLCNINPINNNFTFSCFINPKQTQSKWGFSSSCSSNYSNLLGRNTRTSYSMQELKHFQAFLPETSTLSYFCGYPDTKSIQFHTMFYFPVRLKSQSILFKYKRLILWLAYTPLAICPF